MAELNESSCRVSRDGNPLIVEAALRTSLLELLAGWEPLEDEFPDVDQTLPPLRHVSV